MPSSHVQRSHTPLCCPHLYRGKISSHHRPDNRHPRRHLLFRRKQRAVLNIEIPSNGARISNSLTQVSCTVAYRKTSLFLWTIKRISLLVNDDVVATQTKRFQREGEVTFTLDADELTVGRTHTLQAQASMSSFFGIFQSTVVSPQHTMTKFIEIPPPEIECTFDNSHLYFTGHNEASSYTRGQVYLSWFPALTYGVRQERFLFCGNVTYDTFVVKGDYNFSSSDLTYGQLLDFVSDPRNNAIRLETSSRDLLVRNLEPGASYSILVTARTKLGHNSANRVGALVKAATRDAVLNADFTRMILVPKPTDTFVIRSTTSGGTKNFEFSGSLPVEVVGLKRSDYAYVVDSLGNATLAQLLNVVGAITGTRAVWSYQSADLSNVFDELDFNSDGTDAYETDDAIADEPITAAEELDLARTWDATEDIVKQDICAILSPGSTTIDCLDFAPTRLRQLAPASCPPLARAPQPATSSTSPARAPTFIQQPSGGRTSCSVSGHGNIRGYRNLLNRAEKKFSQRGQKSASRTSSPPWLRPDALNYGQASMIFISQSGRFVTPNNAIEVGVQGFVSVQVRFSIRLSKAEGIRRASLRLFGDIRMTSYVYHAVPQASQVIKSRPLDLFSSGFFNKFNVLGVPIFLDHRAAAIVLVELSSVSDGKSLLWASDGYNFDLNFTYDQSRSPQYQNSSSFSRGAPFSNSPAFYQRANVATEITMLFQWELSVNCMLQATTALEFRTNKAMNVGTRVEALAITNPYFYTLDEFSIDTNLRARLLVGSSSNVANILPVLLLWDFSKISSVRSYAFQLPTYTPSSNSIPSPLQSALSIAKADSTLGNRNDISLAELNVLVPDPYTGGRSILTGSFNKNYSLPYISYSDTNKLTALPTFSLTLKPPETCIGSDAIILTFVLSSNSPGRHPGNVTSALWFGNFDPRVFVEDTYWSFRTVSLTSLTTIIICLPRSTVCNYEMPESATMILRATLDTLPTPYSMFSEWFFPAGSIPKFECCDTADCPSTRYCTAAGMCALY
jgi:hypothetical protein